MWLWFLLVAVMGILLYGAAWRARLSQGDVAGRLWRKLINTSQLPAFADDPDSGLDSSWETGVDSRH
jgi:hypothetical protein